MWSQWVWPMRRWPSIGTRATAGDEVLAEAMGAGAAVEDHDGPGVGTDFDTGRVPAEAQRGRSRLGDRSSCSPEGHLHATAPWPDRSQAGRVGHPSRLGVPWISCARGGRPVLGPGPAAVPNGLSGPPVRSAPSRTSRTGSKGASHDGSGIRRRLWRAPGPGGAGYVRRGADGRAAPCRPRTRLTRGATQRVGRQLPVHRVAHGAPPHPEDRGDRPGVGAGWVRLRALRRRPRRAAPPPAAVPAPRGPGAVRPAAPGLDRGRRLRHSSSRAPGPRPAPGGSRELDACIAEVASTPLSRDRPLWEICVVEGLADGRVGLRGQAPPRGRRRARRRPAAGQRHDPECGELRRRPEPGVGPWRGEPAPGRRRLLADAVVDLGRLAYGPARAADPHASAACRRCFGSAARRPTYLPGPSPVPPRRSVVR